ncbi:hypothetical protein Agsp01_11510 [Agromyces sp. NBRC 114283]|nr:hypothetical protein Agsp01_11510 [Agromyces sp. NBRC 114283]
MTPMESVEAEAFANLHYTRLLEKVPEPPCEFNHTSTTCTGSVTHRARSCEEALNMCQAGRASVEQTLSWALSTCRFCKKPTRDCWRIWPV